ncbi:MAG: sugar ABC transporter permease [Gordonia sp. (in: high G+C Gram-positive bacteria)]
MFVTPFVLVFALVLLAPIGYSIYLTFFQNRLIGGNTFVGLGNYVAVLHDSQFWTGVGHILKFFVIQVPVMLLLAIVGALAIDSVRLRGRTFFRIALFLPYAVPAVVATFMWGFLLGNQFGLLGDLGNALGVKFPNPLGEHLILGAIANIQIWSFTGYNLLIFYSALRTIPAELYEAAELDGANAWWVIRSVKLPALRGSIVIALVFSIIGSFQLFNEPNILEKIAPNSITTYYTPNMYAYNLAFGGQQYNYSATVALVMGVITIAIALGVQYLGNRRDA